MLCPTRVSMLWVCAAVLLSNVAWTAVLWSTVHTPKRDLGGAGALARLSPLPWPRSSLRAPLEWVSRRRAQRRPGALPPSLWEPLGAPRRFASWEPICAVGPAATPAIWQASQPAVLSLAYPGWLGVFSAAQGLGPVMGTHIDFSPARRDSLLALVLDTPSLRTVVIHGMPPGALELAELLHARAPALRVRFVYHGTLSAPIHVSSGEAKLLAGLLDLVDAGRVHSVGTVKHGFHETLLALGVQRAHSVPNFPVVLPHLVLDKFSAADGLLHIGVLASTGGAHKNMIAQLIAACTQPRAVVHVTALPELDYLDFCEAEIVETGLLPHDQFLGEITRMDVLMYVSLVECFPMLVLESAAAGIPILVSRTHHIFDSDPALDAALVVREADSPSEMSQRLAGLAQPAAREALRPNLLALSGCMQRRAEVAWARFLELPHQDRVQLDLARDLSELEVAQATEAALCPATQAPSAPFGRAALAGALAVALAGALAAPPAPAPGPAFRVAFVTYELAPFLPGGAGVVISNLIEDLLQQGVGVTVLAHVPGEVLDKWLALLRSRGWDTAGPSPALIAHHIPTLAGEEEFLAHPCAPQHLFLQRAGLFAEAVGRAYSATPFDAVEVFDYAGAAFDLVRRLRQWQASSGTFSRPPALPPHIPIILRLHGTVQLIHQSEGALAIAPTFSTPPACSGADDSAAWPLMYLMERYALLGAHAIFAQSQAMVELYSAAYGVGRGEFTLAPPPMARVLAPYAGAAWGRGPALGGASAGAFSLLVYGRVARMKGAETVAHAITLISQGLPPGQGLSVAFVGMDWPCPLHARPTSECVREIVRGSTRGGDAIRMSFESAMDRAELCAKAQGFHGGIIASEFETFNLAAHELAACGLPLLTSDIPALREFFTPSNAYPFSAGNASSLALAALSLHRDVAAGLPRTARLRYGDPVEPYRRLVAVARGSPEAAAQLDTASLRATDYAIGIQSRHCFVSHECRRLWHGELELEGEGGRVQAQDGDAQAGS